MEEAILAELVRVLGEISDNQKKIALILDRVIAFLEKIDIELGDLDDLLAKDRSGK